MKRVDPNVHRVCMTPDRCLCGPERAPGEVDAECLCFSEGDTCLKCGAPTPLTCFACGEASGGPLDDNLVGECCSS